ncbi:MAG: hypothetical protein O7C01_12095, partial [Actinobacteria bacterium]|nr:hypothetical protein [Actinomycetota bacterium]
MNSQAQPPRDTKRRRRWPRITLGVVMLGLVVFIAWNTVQLVGVVGDMGAIGDFVLPVDEGQVVASSIATTTQPPPMTEPAPTTTSTSTTTTTFPVGGLGPPCTPSDCDLEVVARVDAGDYIYNDTRGLVGWLLDFVDESFVLEDHPAGVPITMPRWEGSVVAGVLVNLESRRVEGPAVPAYDIPPTSQDLWIATFYFGDHPTTLE